MDPGDFEKTIARAVERAVLISSGAQSKRSCSANAPSFSSRTETVLIAAVSGGADSTAMLAALSAILSRREIPFSLRCLHVEHGIRDAEESRGDADFVRGLCEKLSVPCKIVSIPPGKIAVFAKKNGTGIEAAARYFRRKALFREARLTEQTASDGVRALILTAHTLDDLLELVLMRILRGSGPEGLAAMPQRRGRLFRPLLEIGREQVLGYLDAKKLPWREDSTNKDTIFLRNKIRRNLIPLLNDIYPSWKTGVMAMAETQGLSARFIREAGKGIVYNDGFAEESFFSQPVIVREEALFRAINGEVKIYGGTVKRRLLRRFCRGLIKTADFGQAVAVRQNGRIIVKPAKKECFERGFSLLIKTHGLYTLKGIVINALPLRDAETRGFYASLPLVIRQGFSEDFLATKRGKITHHDTAGKHRLTAVDKFGTAAFIGADGSPLFIREPEIKESAGKIFISLSAAHDGGANVG